MTEAERIAQELTDTPFSSTRYEAAALLRQQAAEIECLKEKEERYTLVDTALKNEVEELRAENETLRYEVDAISAIKEERDKALAGSARLRLENAHHAAHMDRKMGELRAENEQLREQNVNVGAACAELEKEVVRLKATSKPNCRECTAWVKEQADNKEWIEGVKRGREICAALAKQEIERDQS
jgi:FtsZ-binding cell division protein ZapB